MEYKNYPGELEKFEKLSAQLKKKNSTRKKKYSDLQVSSPLFGTLIKESLNLNSYS